MKILGIDYGRKKIGIAVGDTETKLIDLVKTVPNLQFTIYNLQTIINDQKIQKIIIGIPGGKMDEEIRLFGERLKKETNLPVEFFDETLTTQDAQDILIKSGRSRKSRKQKEDAIAAAIMLVYYIEARLC